MSTEAKVRTSSTIFIFIGPNARGDEGACKVTPHVQDHCCQECDCSLHFAFSLCEEPSQVRLNFQAGQN